MKHRWRLKQQEPVLEPADIPLDIQGSLALQDVELVMLVGLPGELSLVLRCHVCIVKIKKRHLLLT